MDSDRKYKQQGYMDNDRDSRGPRGDGPKPQGPRQSIDVTGPRLPRLVQHVSAARCFSCATALPPDMDFKGNCPKCNAELHCCKQCTHFESSTRFQCLKPIPVRIAYKDKVNECGLFAPSLTVAREGTANTPGPSSMGNGNGNGMGNGMSNGGPPAPRNADAARSAFDKLFKKT